ncbi:hypothetical protein ABKV19_024048 [Rosa sericea]
MCFTNICTSTAGNLLLASCAYTLVYFMQSYKLFSIVQVAYLQEEIETLLGNQMINLASGNSSTCGSSEANSNSNSFNGLQVLSQQYDIAVDTQKFQNQPEPPVLLPQVGIASTNQSFSSHEMDIQMPPLHEWEEVKIFGDHSMQDPLERFLEGIDQENFGHNPWLNDPSIAWI